MNEVTPHVDLPTDYTQSDELSLQSLTLSEWLQTFVHHRFSTVNEQRVTHQNNKPKTLLVINHQNDAKTNSHDNSFYRRSLTHDYKPSESIDHQSVSSNLHQSYNL